MTAGPELDALVAEKVMGAQLVRDGDGAWMKVIDGMTDYALEYEVPRYSTDIAAAWEVVEKLYDQRPEKAEAWHFVLQNVGQYYGGPPGVYWQAEFFAEDGAHALTAPHAICLAALRAVGVGVPA